MGVLDPGFDLLRRQLTEEIRASEARTAQRLDAVETGVADLRHHVDVIDAGLRQHIDGSLADVRHEVVAAAAETRRHFDVVAEALRSDIVVVAEGVSTLDEKAERFHAEVRDEFARVDRRFTHLEARVWSTRERS